MNRRLSDEKILFLLVLPGLIGLLVFYIAPFILSFYFALIDNNVGRNFVGLSNFVDTFQNAAFRLGFRNTAVFMAVSLPLNIILPLVMAMLINKTVKFNKMFCLILLLPLVIPSGSVVHFWRSIFGFNGLINGLFFVDDPINWLNTDYALPIITLIYIWKNAGFNMLLFLAGLQFIPKVYYELASVEGMSSIRQFFNITIVYLTPTTFLVFIMSMINSFRAFREIYLLAGAYPHPSIYMLQHFINNQFAMLNYQRMATASYILTLCIVSLVFGLYYLQLKRAKNF